MSFVKKTEGSIQPILLLVAGGILVVFLLTNFIAFRNPLLNTLFPKEESKAATENPIYSIILNPVADAHVLSNQPTTNFGTSNKLTINNGSSVAITYFKFDLNGLTNKIIQTASLIINTTTDANSGSNSTQTIKLLDDNSWLENQISYNLRPTNYSTISGTLSGNKSKNTSYTINLDPLLIQSKTGGLISLVFNSEGTDSLTIYSKEANNISLKPQLTITYTDQPATPSPTSTPNALPGDIDSNGKVDILDYSAVVFDFGKVGTNLLGDVDKNGKVDIFDYSTVVFNFGRTN